MQLARSLPATTFPRLAWRRIGWAVYIGVNLGLMLAWNLISTHRLDWQLWEAMPGQLVGGTLYDPSTALPYPWSPILAPVMALVGLVGPLAFALIHLAFVLLLRDWRLIALTLVSLGFWTNVAGGNTFTFVFVAGVLAFRGSRGWALVYLGLLFLMPRPVQIPLALWLMWTMPAIRLPAVAMFAVHAVAVLLTGYGPAWIGTMLAMGVPSWSIGPSWWIGMWWLAIGVPAGGYLLWRGHPGWAGLMVSPYWVSHYFLMPLVEWKDD